METILSFALIFSCLGVAFGLGRASAKFKRKSPTRALFEGDPIMFGLDAPKPWGVTLRPGATVPFIYDSLPLEFVVESYSLDSQDGWAVRLQEKQPWLERNTYQGMGPL